MSPKRKDEDVILAEEEEDEEIVILDEDEQQDEDDDDDLIIISGEEPVYPVTSRVTRSSRAQSSANAAKSSNANPKRPKTIIESVHEEPTQPKRSKLSNSRRIVEGILEKVLDSVSYEKKNDNSVFIDCGEEIQEITAAAEPSKDDDDDVEWLPQAESSSSSNNGNKKSSDKKSKLDLPKALKKILPGGVLNLPLPDFLPPPPPPKSLKETKKQKDQEEDSSKAEQVVTEKLIEFVTPDNNNESEQKESESKPEEVAQDPLNKDPIESPVQSQELNIRKTNEHSRSDSKAPVKVQESFPLLPLRKKIQPTFSSKKIVKSAIKFIIDSVIQRTLSEKEQNTVAVHQTIMEIIYESVKNASASPRKKTESETSDIMHLDENDEPLKKCHFCSRYTPKMRPGLRENALFEREALREIGEDPSSEERAQVSVTRFCLFDEAGHMVAITDGLVEKGRDVYLSGFIKPPYDENKDDPRRGTGAWMEKTTRITEWWTTGFQPGETVTTGVSTEVADYYLQKTPEEEYRPFNKELIEKTLLTKFVFEIAQKEAGTLNDVSYDDLVMRLANMVEQVHDLEYFSEEILLRHADYIISQIASYERQKNGNPEDNLLYSKCIRTLLSYTGLSDKYLGGKKKTNSKSKNKNGDDDIVEILDDDDDSSDPNFVAVDDGSSSEEEEIEEEEVDEDGVTRKVKKKVKKSSSSAIGAYSKARMESFVKATTTALVRQCFEQVMRNQIKEIEDEEGGKKKKKTLEDRIVRDPVYGEFIDLGDSDDEDEDEVDDSSEKKKCGVCPGCMRPDCGTCPVCLRMAKYGGEGAENNDTCLKRLCSKEMEESDLMVINELPLRRGREEDLEREKSTKIKFTGEPEVIGSLKFYKSVDINDGEMELKLGDCVTVLPEVTGTPHHIAKLISLIQDTETKQKYSHVLFFARGGDTILGETADPKELFFLGDHCEDLEIHDIVKRVEVSYWPVEDAQPYFNPSVDDPDAERTNNPWEVVPPKPPIADNESSFWFRMKYVPEFARFEVMDDEELEFSTLNDYPSGCQMCDSAEERTLQNKPEPILDPVTRYCTGFKLRGETYGVGDGVLFKPEQFSRTTAEELKIMVKSQKQESPAKDHNIYTEYYRKPATPSLKGSHEETPDPFQIAVVDKISLKRVNVEENEGDLEPIIDTEVILRVRRIYRPEQTQLTEAEYGKWDVTKVFWSDTFERVNAAVIVGKCVVLPGVKRPPVPNHIKPEDAYFHYETPVFTCDEKFDPDTYEFTKVSESVGVKKEPRLISNPYERRPLRTLDVFSGCGGLSKGLDESGISESVWAIENYPPAAEAYKLNNPNCHVLISDCNSILQQAMDGRTTDKDSDPRNPVPIPRRGQVEMLVGGPPCQGFSHMNIFTEREYSKFKNSLISTYLSYCDFYRPKFFILENVQAFATFKKNLILKMTMRALVMMGYQCSFAVLQAGHYGVPQTRRRTIVMAAAPDQKLPLFPEPRHVFARTGLSVKVDGKLFSSNNSKWGSLECAPYRAINISDGLSDLPVIENGASMHKIPYKSKPQSHFQRMMRRSKRVINEGGPKYMDRLDDHICRNLAPLIVARISFVPTHPGSDWRDIPNISIKLPDGTVTEILRYICRDKHQPRGLREDRGVCTCVSSKKSKASCISGYDKQTNTLIPWSLPHTGQRHNQWAGLYGRIHWDGFFSTTVTNPEPISKQGRVLHPVQHRVVSVRECARSQGFPDDYKFYGTVMEKHRQIGNAVPPSMAKALGLQIGKAIEDISKTNPRRSGLVLEKREHYVARRQRYMFDLGQEAFEINMLKIDPFEKPRKIFEPLIQQETPILQQKTIANDEPMQIDNDDDIIMID